MKFNRVDRKTFSRRDTFSHFMTDVPCTYSMCVEIDVTSFLRRTKEKERKFFASFLYGLTKAVNAHPEFRMGWDEEGELGCYERTSPSYTVFHEESESFSNVVTDAREDFSAFYAACVADIEACKKSPFAGSAPARSDVFNVSALPWVSFTSFHLNLQKGYDYLAPIFTMGKIEERGEKAILPLAVQVHHAVCDGFHAARLVHELQTWCNEFEG